MYTDFSPTCAAVGALVVKSVLALTAVIKYPNESVSPTLISAFPVTVVGCGVDLSSAIYTPTALLSPTLIFPDVIFTVGPVE